jgi:CopG antitoxin of type II toxin-antitoxin system
MKRQIPELKTDEEAEAFLEQDLSDIDFAQFKRVRFNFRDRSSKEEAMLGLEGTGIRSRWFWPLEAVSWISTAVLVVLVAANAVPALRRHLPIGDSYLVEMGASLCVAVVANHLASSIRIRQLVQAFLELRKRTTRGHR